MFQLTSTQNIDLPEHENIGMIETNISEQLLPRASVFESLGEAMSKFLLGLDNTNLSSTKCFWWCQRCSISNLKGKHLYPIKQAPVRNRWYWSCEALQSLMASRQIL